MTSRRQDLLVYTESELNLPLSNTFGKSDWIFAPSLKSRILSPSFNLQSIPFFCRKPFKFLENIFQQYFILLILIQIIMLLHLSSNHIDTLVIFLFIMVTSIYNK